MSAADRLYRAEDPDTQQALAWLRRPAGWTMAESAERLRDLGPLEFIAAAEP